jgi:hypothetical protein
MCDLSQDMHLPMKFDHREAQKKADVEAIASTSARISYLMAV